MPLILGTNSIKDSTFSVANSCRFNDDDSPSMTKASTTVTDDKKFTISAWCKRGNMGDGSGNEFGIFGHRSNSNNGNNNLQFGFYQDHIYCAFVSNNGSDVHINKVSDALYQDPTAWYHVMLAVDTTQGTAANRNRIYVNGTEVTSFSTDTNAPSDRTFLNDACNIDVGRYTNTGGTNFEFDGYLAEVVYIDGLQLTPSSFGEFNEDSPTIWQPKDVSGLTFGNNGFYLDFEDSSNLGNDANGGTDLTESNLDATDQSTDTCTNNYATLNPLNVPTSNAPTFAEGSLFGESVTGGTSSVAFGGSSTFGLTQGKWYLEAKCGSSTSRDAIGVTGEASECARTNNSGISRTNSSFLYSGETGTVYVNSSSTSYGNTFGNNDIIGVALDLDNLKVYFSKNGTWQNSGDPTSGSTGTGAISITSVSSTTDGAYFINHGSTAGGGAPSGKSVFNFNFGNPPFTISSGNSDGNGYGNFEYSVPSGYYALNSKNLAEYG